MRLLMGISKNRHGTYYAIKQVPQHLQEAVARILDNGKARQSWLKRSLGTKDAVQANRLAKPVLIEFDRTLDRAKALLVARPIRTSLSAVEIKRMVEYYYANKLVSHDKFVRDAPEIEAETRRLEPDAGPWDTDPIPEFGLSGGQQFDFADNMPTIMKEAEAALGKGDIGNGQTITSSITNESVDELGVKFSGLKCCVLMCGRFVRSNIVSQADQSRYRRSLRLTQRPQQNRPDHTALSV